MILARALVGILTAVIMMIVLQPTIHNGQWAELWEAISK